MMKKTTFWLIAICCFAYSWQSFAQYTFPTITGPTLVAQSSDVTENVNDLANTAAVPAGLYDSFSISVDWANNSNAWSNEADMTITTTAGSIVIDPPTAGGGNNTAATTLTFSGDFAGLYDPTVDGYLDLVYGQSYNGSSANWSNIIITLNEAPTCPATTDLAVSNITPTSADLSWVAGNAETLWNVEYGPTGFTQGSGVSSNGLTSTSTPVLGLTAATTYDFYVQADCGAGDTSEWTGPFSFTTLCVAFTPDYCEDFATADTGAYNNNTVPTCWTFLDPTPGTSGYGYVTSDQDFRLYNSSDTTGDYILVGPSTTGLTSGNYRVNFDVRAGASGQSIIVGTMDGNTASSTFTAISTIALSSTSYENHIVNIPAGTDGHIAFKHGQDGSYDNFYLDNICVQTIPTCPEPLISSLTVSNITSTSADLGWTESGTSTAWDVEVVTAGTAPTGTATASGVSNPYNVTGLTSNTEYEFYVRADCGAGDLSYWTGPLSFTTLCEAFLPNYCEDFATADTGAYNNNTVPGCWTFLDPTPGTGGYGYVNTDDEFYLYNSSDSTGDYILVGPNTTGLSSGANRVTFDVKATGSGQSIIVGTMDGNLASSTFTAITTIALSTTSYENHIVNIPAGTDGHIAFKHGQNGTYDSYRLDNICVEPMPSCPEPLINTMTVSNITSTSADLGWTESGTSTAWDVEVVTAGTTPTGTATASGVSNPYNVTGLTSNTEYEFYVRADCGAGDVSVWTGPFSFSTLCDAFAPNYCEDFATVSAGTSSNPTVPGCWTFIDSGSGYGYVNSSAEFYFYNGFDGTGDYILVGPNTTGLSSGTNRVTFDVKATGSGQSIVVGTMDGNLASSTFTPIITIALATTGYESYVVNIPSGTDGHIAFKHGQDGTYDSYRLDNICVEPIPSCPSVAFIEASNVLAGSADISWTAGNTETLWNIEYGVTGFTPGSGTTVSGVTNPYTLSGLTSQTDYDVYVQADCTAGDLSEWAGPFNFTTACDAFSSLPLCEDFSTTPSGTSTNPTIPSCWSFIDSGAGYGYVNYSQAFYMYNSSDDAGDYILVSPEITNVADGTNRVKFTVDGSADQTLIVGTMTDSGNASTFTAIQTVTLATSNNEVHIVNIPLGTDGFVAIKHGMVGTYDSYTFDSICIEPIPSCPDLSDFAVDSVTDTTAQFSWTNGGSEAAWNLEWGTPNFVFGSGLTAVATTNPYTLTGLTPSTSYDIYIQADCGAGDTSPWIGPFSFTTACGAYEPDYLEDFSTYSWSTLPDCWEEADNSPLATGPVVGNGTWAQDGYLNSGTTGAARFNFYNANDTGDWLISPYIDLSGGICELTFDLGITAFSGTANSAMGSDDELKLLVTTDGGANWTTLMTWDVNNPPSNTGSQIVVDLTSYNNAYTKFAFWATEGTVDDAEDYNVYVDNFEVTMITPICSDPSDLTVANITDTSADLTWIENGNATTWDIELVVAGTPPTGTATNADVATNPFTVTGLLPDVSYEFYVLAACETGISGWVGPFSFTTNSTLDINENEQIEFSYYPNPVNNVLNLNAQNTIDAVVVLNVLGQQVAYVEPNSLSTIVNMADLSEGAYFVRVVMGNAAKTIRIIKK
ncbi:fibronectin type III domain-containing protein [Mangrovimonas aestuarii]|uniref:fibronectin type III domain-containing protein n=1 Tax=Mangrovimonas aestuarii TaxID=3018443 RepID=UPI002379027D|nr:fibronectin type III domain-containing protein [Mangrovimonas aestuarii]